MRKLWILGVVLTVLSSGAVALADAVLINGTPLVSSLQPVNLGGNLLLPMRDVFEALQAEVKWFAAERKIMALRGETTIQLILGSRLATINGTPMQLPVAPQLIGTSTYVPLRFPAEAFGGTVKWDPATRTAIIETPATGEVAGGGAEGGGTVTPPVAEQPQPFEGTLVQIYGGANPNVVIQLSGSDNLRLLQVLPTTILTRGVAGAEAPVATVQDLQTGDLVQGLATADNKAVRLSVSFGEKTGKIVALAGNTLVFEDGTALTLAANVQVVGANNAPASLAQVTAGSEATVRFQPLSKAVWRIALAAAPTPPPTTDKVEIFTLGILNPGTVFKTGDKLTVQLQGTPGGIATANISGRVAKDLALPEVKAGVYQAVLTVPENTEAPNVKLTGNLSKGAVRARTVVSATLITIDSTPPRFVQLEPEANKSIDNTSPTLVVRYDDGAGSGVDLNTLRLKLGGQDVTANTTIGETESSYSAQNLRQGQHTAEVTVQDLAGNVAKATWSFSIVSPGQGVLTAVTHTAKSVLQQGQKVTISARVLETGGTATYSIGAWKRNLPMSVVAGQPTLYRAIYTVQAGDKVTDALITVTYRNPRGMQGTMAATNPISLDASLPTTLQVSSPAEGSKVGDQITVQGVAPPNSQVRVTIDFKAKLLTWVTGQLWQGAVRADNLGKWTTQAISSDVFLGKASEYTIKAELLDAGGKVQSTLSRKLVK